MTKAELGFLGPLFDLAGSLTDSDDIEHMTMGLGEAAEGSLLDGDDTKMNGYWVSMVVNNGILAALDHIITLRDAILRENGAITLNAPWTLLRGALESVSVAVWVMQPGQRATRRARALRVWHYDFCQRFLWENDVGRTPVPPAKSGEDRAKLVAELAVSLGIPANKVTTDLNYADTVFHAARAAGQNPLLARARWREASAFAHGRTWPLLSLASPSDAQVIRGGVGVSLTLDESRVRPLAELTFALLNEALLRYSDLAAAPAE